MNNARQDRGKRYLIVGLDCRVGWPSRDQMVKYAGREFRLRPASDQQAPSVVMVIDGGLSDLDARRLVNELLSAIAWVRRGGIVEVISVISTVPAGVGGGRSRLIDDSSIEYLPNPSDPRARLALGLFREGQSVNNVGYQFLAYAKTFNILHQSGPAQQQWITSTLPSLTDREARKRIAELRNQQIDVANEIYISGRCAVAHAYTSPVVNPDDPSHMEQLSRNLPLVRALAEHVIEHEFAVKSMQTVWKEHLYQLEGFREQFGPQIVTRLKAGEEVHRYEITLPDRLSVRMRGHPQAESFESLELLTVFITASIVTLRMSTSDHLMQLDVVLDLSEETLSFDAIRSVVLQDDGSAMAMQRRLDYIHLLRAWLANGIVEVWDLTADKRLGRSDPILLTNFFPDWDMLALEEQATVHELKTRTP